MRKKERESKVVKEREKERVWAAGSEALGVG